MDSQTSPYCTDSGHAFDDCFGISCIWCKIIIDPGALAPNGHPYITSTKLIEKFGSKYMVVIGITPNQGDIYQPQVLEKSNVLPKKWTTPRRCSINYDEFGCTSSERDHG